MSTPLVAVRWDHIHLRSSDPDAAARFYVESFGAEPRDRSETPERFRVTVSLQGVTLLIDGVPAGQPAPPEPPFAGLEHLGLRVDDIDAAVAALEARGVRTEGPVQTLSPVLRIAFLRGPDNVRIELLQRG